MRVAVLSSSLGYGHMKAAYAIEERLREKVPDSVVEYIDFWSLMDSKVAGVIRESYLDLVRNEPGIYDRLHRFDRRQWREFFRNDNIPPALAGILCQTAQRKLPDFSGFPGRGATLDQTLFLNLIDSFSTDTPVSVNIVRRGLVFWMHRLLVRRLKQRLHVMKPEVVVATQMMPASLLAWLKQRRELDNLPLIGVLTDYGIHAFWLNACTDLYCVGTRSMANELLAHGRTPSSVDVTGIPLLKGFRQPPSQAAARERLGCRKYGRAVLVTGGGYGIGARGAIESVLSLDMDCEVLVAAGGCEAEGEDLSEFESCFPGRVRVFGKNVDMPALVRASDIVIGKPGGLSVSEALACGRPFLAVCCLGGQELYNVTHLERHGAGALVDGVSARDWLRSWLADPLKLSQIQYRAWRTGRRRGAERTVDAMLLAKTQNTAQRPAS